MPLHRQKGHHSGNTVWFEITRNKVLQKCFSEKHHCKRKQGWNGHKLPVPLPKDVRIQLFPKTTYAEHSASVVPSGPGANLINQAIANAQRLQASQGMLVTPTEDAQKKVELAVKVRKRMEKSGNVLQLVAPARKKAKKKKKGQKAGKKEEKKKKKKKTQKLDDLLRFAEHRQVDTGLFS